MSTKSFIKSCPAEFATSKRKEEIHMFGFPIVDFWNFTMDFKLNVGPRNFCFQCLPDNQPTSCCLIAPSLLKQAGIR